MAKVISNYVGLPIAPLKMRGFGIFYKYANECIDEKNILTVNENAINCTNHLKQWILYNLIFGENVSIPSWISRHIYIQNTCRYYFVYKTLTGISINDVISHCETYPHLNFIEYKVIDAVKDVCLSTSDLNDKKKHILKKPERYLLKVGYYYNKAIHNVLSIPLADIYKEQGDDFKKFVELGNKLSNNPVEFKNEVDKKDESLFKVEFDSGFDYDFVFKRFCMLQEVAKKLEFNTDFVKDLINSECSNLTTALFKKPLLSKMPFNKYTIYYDDVKKDFILRHKDDEKLVNKEYFKCNLEEYRLTTFTSDYTSLVSSIMHEIGHNYNINNKVKEIIKMVYDGFSQGNGKYIVNAVMNAKNKCIEVCVEDIFEEKRVAYLFLNL